MVKLAHGRLAMRRRSRRRPACARSACCSGPSARAPTPTAPSAPRPTAPGLDARDRAFAQQLAYGAVQHGRRSTTCSAALSSRPAETIELPLLDALRLGVLPAALLDGVPDHAAVGQTVELAKDDGHGGHRLANAVMRRATREARGLVAQLDGRHARPRRRVRHSHPDWIARMWWDALGPEETVALIERDNEPAESAMRVNKLLVTTREAGGGDRRAGVESAPGRGPAGGARARRPFDVHGSELVREGALMPQSRASMLVARVLDPQPGERVLDMCAAPGCEDHPPRGADAQRGRGGGGREARAVARGARGERRAARGDVRRGREADARERRTASSTGSCSTRRAPTSARSSRGPTFAGGRTSSTVERLVPEQERLLDAAAERCGRAGRWCTRPARSRRRRTSARSTASSSAARDFQERTGCSCCRTATAPTASSSRA